MTLIADGKQAVTSSNAGNINTLENNEYEEEYEDENDDFLDGKIIKKY